MSGLELRPVGRHNFDAVRALDAGDAQQQVASNLYSIAEAAVMPEAWIRAIYVDGRPVGFLLLNDPTLSADAEEKRFSLWRLMIDKSEQGRGFGRLALLALIEHVRTRPGARELFTSYVHDGPTGPNLADFYASLGFVATGEIDDDETVLCLSLDDSTTRRME
ncbi:GNAT family N-acetyltransferase [Roseateles oligotrophus]|uniref:GNAT family N-acetyltransferase n=1 Tax=Roseateles oligotrophus TaxID=1769250 RepID=A0ABT2YDB7_9BURK|nr:GNAT family N-acetyltransferase [Roseateles oligotrophus]MCV2368039.1 GNAT family N-acetyltransferase [Roseateles oligotrophus]